MRKITKSQKKSKVLNKRSFRLGQQLTLVKFLDADCFRFRLRFADGTSGTLSLSSVFSKPKNLAAEVLRGNMLSLCFVENGALAWPNGLEICADKLRMLVEQDKQAA